MELQGLRAMIVGGASGMARATAERIVKGGGRVAIVDREQSKGAEVAAALGASWHPADVLDFVGMEKVIVDVVNALGGIDVMVNTAGGGVATKTLGKDGPHPLDSFRWTMDLNVNASFNISRLVSAEMAKNEPNDDGERGVLINTASIAAFEGQIGQVAYAAAKSAMIGMTFVMARDLGSYGIRANCIAPSLFDTGLTTGIPDDFKGALTKDAAFPKRMGRPDEYAKLAVMIIENPMMNGGTIRLDAGQRFAPK